MATKDGVTAAAATSRRDESFWLCIVLGVFLVAVGILVLGDIALATVVSTVAIASAAILAGGFEIAHAFWKKGLGAFAWQILLGTLYVAFGVALIGRPEFGAAVLTYVLGLILLASGVVRIFLGSRYGFAGWLLLMSGVVGIAAGIVLLARWPITGVWAIGFLLGVDLILHGTGWLALAWRRAAKPDAGSGTDERSGPG